MPVGKPAQSMNLDIEQLRAAMPGRRIDYYSTTDSTMYAAARLAAEGCESGTTVIAEEQSAGQGRHGHSWQSEAGCGIYCSIVLRLPLAMELLPVVTLALGLATADAIARVTDTACDLRWPNDVMLGGRKVAGILVQLVEGASIAGIGINVNQRSFPPEIAAEATSLRLHLGRKFERERLLEALLPAVDAFAGMLVEDGKETILRLFTHASSYASGRRVTVNQTEGAIEGVTAGLDASGFLVVRKDDGTSALILAGGVRAAGS
ncbi:MAG TPA: biotin--[acetyl-CoA-carboxylase] ligase [Bryobacteraceae bacterium]|nr:biotin--[acetyl-CoA-carboxylase] ligase [Bryobacteraceae bacterium]